MYKSDVPLLLTDARVDSNAGEVTLAQQLIELSRTKSALDEDDDLVELEVIEQVVELPILLSLRELDVVLLKAV